MFRPRAIGLLLGVLLWALSTNANEQGGKVIEITHEQALSFARKRGPALEIAAARVSEAESHTKAAAVWKYNPTFQVSAGPRFDTGDTTTDWSIGVQQWFELGGQKKNRIKAAQAFVLAEQARSLDAQRLLLREVSLTFIKILYWHRRVVLSQENLRIAREIQRIANRRYQVGEAGALEKSVARLWVVRASSTEDRARALFGQAKGHLKGLLGIKSGTKLEPRGDLRELTTSSSHQAKIMARPDLQALGADIRQAQAQAELGRASRLPNFAIGASYAQEEAQDIVRGNLAISVPLFDRGQGSTAVAEARSQVAQAKLRQAKRTAVTETNTFLATARRLGQTVERFERDGLATLERAEHLATTSYKAGAIPLGELMSLRRELVQAKLEYTELLLAAASAQTNLAAASGALQ